MARDQSSPQHDIELRPHAAVRPGIAVTNASCCDENANASPSPAPSELSTGRASTPGSRNAPSPSTPSSSVYNPGETISREPILSEAEAQTIIPLVENEENAEAPPQSPNATISSWRSRVSWAHLTPGNRTQQFLGLGVCALTIVTVVYSHRADRNARWQNGLDYYQACAANNYVMEDCESYRLEHLVPPPYDPWKMFIWSSKRSFEDMTQPDQVVRRSIDTLSPADAAITPAAQEQFAATASALVLALMLLASSIYLSVQTRRSKQVKLSEQSMARKHFVRPNISPTAEIGAGGETTGNRQFKVFVTAETAINRLKAQNKGKPTGRRSSTPWRSNGLDPFMFEDAMVYNGESQGDNTDTTTWRQIKQRRGSCATFAESPSTLYFPHVDYATPLKLPPSLGLKARDEEKLQHIHPLRRWFMPRQIVVSNQPVPELDEGDIKGAITLMGAATAATGGGTAMRMCPVEVPINKHHLLESWMHISPQDASTSA